jgi:hypothetical protein
VRQLTGSLADAVLTFGEASVNQTIVPIGAKPATAHQPYQVFGTREVTVRDLHFTIKRCDVGPGIITEYKQAPAHRLVLSCWLDAVYRGPASFHFLDESHLRLQLPDQTAAGPAEHPNQNLYRDVKASDVYYAFYINDPPAGAYSLRFVDQHLSTESLGPNDVVNVALTVPSSPPAPHTSS